jgi:uncharacterized protein YdcH (DUF465 family)
MSHTPHELAAEFPEYAERMHALKTQDAHFARLFDEYHQVNREIHRAETNIEPMDDLTMIDLRKTRLRLKDQLYGLLAMVGVYVSAG